MRSHSCDVDMTMHGINRQLCGMCAYQIVQKLDEERIGLCKAPRCSWDSYFALQIGVANINSHHE